MSDEVKAEHRLVGVSEAGPSDWPTFRWLCACGEHEHGYVSENVARDAHAEHAQESGEYGLGTGFEVVESLHGQECEGCRQDARSAVIGARVTGSVGATYSTAQPGEPWEEPEVAHSATVRRIKIENELSVKNER